MTRPRAASTTLWGFVLVTCLVGCHHPYGATSITASRSSPPSSTPPRPQYGEPGSLEFPDPGLSFLPPAGWVHNLSDNNYRSPDDDAVLDFKAYSDMAQWLDLVDSKLALKAKDLHWDPMVVVPGDLEIKSQTGSVTLEGIAFTLRRVMVRTRRGGSDSLHGLLIMMGYPPDKPAYEAVFAKVTTSIASSY